MASSELKEGKKKNTRIDPNVPFRSGKREKGARQTSGSQLTATSKGGRDVLRGKGGKKSPLVDTQGKKDCFAFTTIQKRGGEKKRGGGGGGTAKDES